ncbi:MAG: T9SS type A sorting domain-containing protein [Crocinitomicaceae bacterium]|nr:T9SS type A sorting domain-containing protein [Crocinitomicaceae bacterium]MBK8926521.1 T9SS type A sorting domain-containing protein [Crocinitomicaceae bacterium]
MRKLLMFLLLLSLGNTVSATHLAGGHMEYECLGDGLYKVRLVFFRDCSGLEVHPNDGPTLWLESTTCGVACIDMGQMEHVSHENVNYGCGNTCLFGSYPGFQKWIFEKTIFLPFECPDWKASIYISARNTTEYAGSGNYFNYILINNQAGVCNNSPVFTDMSVWVGCLNTFSQFENSHTEADGDQLIFEITSPLNLDFPPNCNSAPITYDSGLNFGQPFPSTSPFTINSTTGVVNFTPILQGTSYFGIKVKEYRSGILVSETIRDGEIIVVSCTPADDVTFGFWNGSDSYSLSVSPYQDSCFVIPITADADIIDVSTLGLSPSNYNVASVGIGTENAHLSICPIWDSFGGFCDPIFAKITVMVTTELEACFANGGSGIKIYNLIINPVGYCPEYRFFTNRNPDTGILMPLYAKASNTIWVGDSMPPFGPSPSQWGEVIYSGDITLEAGVEIIIPNCSGGSGVTDCVILSGNQTLILKPSNCSPDCELIELEIDVKDTFNCHEESVRVSVLSGTPPYTFVWTDESDNILGYGNSINVHDYVSSQEWDSVFHYNLYVEDAVGMTANYSGLVHGTSRFYSPLWYNMYPFPVADFEDNKWYCYPELEIDTNAVYLYDGNFSVYYNYPMVLWDGINSTPPWYGATKIEFRVFDSYGSIQREKIVDLEETDDWSMDNYEFYWDGTTGNTGDPDDCLNSPLDVFNYTLLAENCQTIPHCETGMIIHFACYEGDWNDSVWVVKSAESSNYGGVIFNDGRTSLDPLSLDVKNSNWTQNIEIYPNPANNIVYLNGKSVEIDRIELYDMKGKLVLMSTITFINISDIAPGSYLVKIITSEGVTSKQLVVN